MEGVDYAFSSPSPAKLAVAGKRFAMRYVGPGSDPKHLHALERDALWQAGLSIVLLAEGRSGDAVLGSKVGIEHAASAQKAALVLGAPANIPIYFAIDFDVTSAQWPLVANYLRGCGSVIGQQRVGVYASVWGLKWAALSKLASWGFQAYAPAWSGGTNASPWSYAHVVQYKNNVTLAGGTVDLCRAQQHAFGQWTKSGVSVGEVDMDQNQDTKLSAIVDFKDNMVLDTSPNEPGGEQSFPVALTAYLKQLGSKVDTLITKVDTLGPAPVDLEAYRTIVREEINKSRLTG